MTRITVKIALTLLVFTVGVGCSNSGDSANKNNLESEAPKSATTLTRMVILGSALDDLKEDISQNGGHVVRNLDFIDGVVAQIPSAALEGLRHRFQNVEFYDDVVLNLVDPEEFQEKGKPGSPGGGGSTQPAQQTPWGISRIGANLAHEVHRGSGTTVCVVDTGIDETHPDLSANIVGGRNFVMNRGKVNPTQWDDDNGHGSHVAGIIASLDNSIGTIGVAPEASLYAVKALDKRGSGYLSDVTDGIHACINAGADVINMSLGATGDPNSPSPMKTAIETATSLGILVVVAAGNEGDDISNHIPAGYSSVIAVAATDSSDHFPTWSNFGLSAKDYSAPGVSIYSTWKDGSYSTISGTSMAAPHVTGVAALKIAASSLGFLAIDLGYSLSVQGSGLMDAQQTVLNQ